MATLLSDKINDLMHGMASEPQHFYQAKGKYFLACLPVDELNHVVIDEPADGIKVTFDLGFLRVEFTKAYFEEWLEEYGPPSETDDEV